MDATLIGYTLGAAGSLAVLGKGWTRLQLSLAKHPSLRGHSKMARRVARWMRGYTYQPQDFFRSDDAPREITERRVAGFERLADAFSQRFPKTLALTLETEAWVSDMQFTSAYRVPFQYSELVRNKLRVGAFMQASSGGTLTDLDGNLFYDLTGSYGVNVLGYDTYKGCLDRAHEAARELGPVLGYYHPVVARCAERLCDISGMDEVSFHMSGTEAVMQAVRLARYHTRRTHLVRFCGAYHGWWGDVQPGIGNPVPAHETYTLKDMHQDTLRVLRTRRDIACVLVNPLQALHPNANAPSDGMLVDSSRSAHFDREAYTNWLRQLRAICTERNIVLIFDEVFVGFRLARGGAQEYFGVQADMVTYGKTLGGGLPVGVVCGKKQWMQRFRANSPSDVCFARGTFNSHPYVMAAMNEFLDVIDGDAVKRVYANAEEVWNTRALTLNRQLEAAKLPLRIANLQSIWTVSYTQPCRYNWMLQYYLHAEGLALSWIGTGRFIFRLDTPDAEFAEISRRLLCAAVKMQADGYWWAPAAVTNQQIRRKVLRELLRARFA
jgi:glutamate-1-semialdehyde 2,1-aminomutase